MICSAPATTTKAKTPSTTKQATTTTEATTTAEATTSATSEKAAMTTETQEEIVSHANFFLSYEAECDSTPVEAAVCQAACAAAVMLDLRAQALVSDR